MNKNILLCLIASLNEIKILSDKNSLPNALLLYGDDCDYLLSLAKEFIIYTDVRCDSIPPLPSVQCKDVDVFKHPDIKWLFPIMHNNVNDSCDKYLDSFAKYVNGSLVSNKASWQKVHMAGNKQMTINAIDVANVNLFLSLPNVLGKYKIVVIWLPEFMNNVTANTLLKTLEEPAGNKAMFLLLTNDIDGILPTIKSRCLNFFVKNFRGNNILDKNNDDKIDKNNDDNRQYSEFIDFLRLCYKFDMSQMYEYIERLHYIGKEEIIHFFSVGIDIMQDILYRHCGIKQCDIVEEELGEALQKLSQNLDFGKIKYIYDILTSGINDIRRNVNTKMLIFKVMKNINTCFLIN